MMSRDITPEEKAQFPNLSFTPIAIGRDAVAPVISSEIYDAGVKSLSLAEIAAVYRGEIDNWNKLGGPDKAIFVVDKESSSGTRQTFMKVVMGNSKASAPGADLVIGSNNEEQTAITQSDSAIVIREDISPEAQAFIDYLLSETGQSFVSESGYIPVK